MASIRVVLALTSQIKVQARTFAKTKAEERITKEESKEGTNPQSGLSVSETPNEEGYGQPWESDDWSASHWSDDSWTPDAGWFLATPLNLANHPTRVVLDLSCTRSIGSRTANEILKTHAWYYGITTEFRSDKSFVFANSERETCKESCIIHFPTIPTCSTKVDVLETSDVPIVFSSSQMKNLGMTVELDLKRDKITTMGHIALELTNLAYQPTTM